jgi:phenylacetate-coenzyme A ligase PaaK-like adenylate-forming protein
MVSHPDAARQDFSCLRLATSAGEGLPEELHARWDRTFGVPLLDGLGTAEMWHIFLSNRPGRIRPGTLGEVVPGFEIKVADEEGRELPDGEPGEVVVSNLVNRGTVLLNYRLGDRAAKLSGDCPCGRSLPRMTLPEGRSDDWVEGTDGELVHAQAIRGLILADDRWILRFQIEQRSRSSFTVAAVTTADADHEALGERIQQRFANRFGPSTETEVAFVDELERTPGGKVRVVRSRRTGAQPAVS